MHAIYVFSDGINLIEATWFNQAAQVKVAMKSLTFTWSLFLMPNSPIFFKAWPINGVNCESFFKYIPRYIKEVGLVQSDVNCKKGKK